MSKIEITAVGIDVSKGKSTVAVRRPGGEIVMMPFTVLHTAEGLAELTNRTVWWHFMTWTVRGDRETLPSARAVSSARATRTPLSMCTAM